MDNKDLVRKYPMPVMTGNRFIITYKERSYHPVGGIAMSATKSGLGPMWKRVISNRKNNDAVLIKAYHAELVQPDFEMRLMWAKQKHEDKVLRPARSWLEESAKSLRDDEFPSGFIPCVWSPYSYLLPYEDETPDEDFVMPTEALDPNHDQCENCRGTKRVLDGTLDLEAIYTWLMNQPRLFNRIWIGQRKSKKKITPVPRYIEPGLKLSYPLQIITQSDVNTINTIEKLNEQTVRSTIAVGKIVEIEMPVSVKIVELQRDADEVEEKAASKASIKLRKKIGALRGRAQLLEALEATSRK
jgi:hypothetical protein